MKPLYNTITVMTVSQSNYSDLPFNNIDNNEIDFAHNNNNKITMLITIRQMMIPSLMKIFMTIVN